VAEELGEKRRSQGPAGKRLRYQAGQQLGSSLYSLQRHEGATFNFFTVYNADEFRCCSLLLLLTNAAAPAAASRLLSTHVHDLAHLQPTPNLHHLCLSLLSNRYPRSLQSMNSHTQEFLILFQIFTKF
jgi:hypothetical protein